MFVLVLLTLRGAKLAEPVAYPNSVKQGRGSRLLSYEDNGASATGFEGEFNVE